MGWRGSVASALLLFATACSSGGRSPTPTPTLAASSPKPRPSVTTASPSPTLGKPAGPTIFARTNDGRIAAVSAESGAMFKYLTDQQPGGGPDDLSLSSDGSTLYFTRGEGTCAGHLATIPAAGGREGYVIGQPKEADMRTNEGYPSPRPDGQFIAFVRYFCNGHNDELAIDTLTSKPSERATEPLHNAARPRWSSDGTKVAVAGEPSVVYDVETTGRITKTRVIPAPTGCYDRPADFTPNGTLILNQSCGKDAEAQVSILEVDPRTTATVRTIRILPPGNGGGAIALDRTGTQLLYEEDVLTGTQRCLDPYCPTYKVTYARLVGGRPRLISVDPPYRLETW